MDLVTQEKLRGESKFVKSEHRHKEYCETTQMTADDDRCQLLAKTIKVLGLVYRKADLRHLRMVLATKAGKKFRVAGIVMPDPKFISGQAVRRWSASMVLRVWPQSTPDRACRKQAGILVFKRSPRYWVGMTTCRAWIP